MDEDESEVFNVFVTMDNGRRAFSHSVVLVSTGMGVVTTRFPGSAKLSTTSTAEWDKLDIEPCYRTRRLPKSMGKKP